ncbi:hypothetical protein TSMEX_000219, partial [Taenia solium]
VLHTTMPPTRNHRSTNAVEVTTHSYSRTDTNQQPLITTRYSLPLDAMQGAIHHSHPSTSHTQT